MKQLLFLLLFPCLCVAQYTGNAGQKITLGEQTSADGLVFRGNAADTVAATLKITKTNKSDTSAFLLLDTINNVFLKYNIGTTYWTRLNILPTDTASMLGNYWRSNRFSGVLPVANGGTEADMSSLPNNYLIRKNASGIFDTANVYEANGNIGLNVTPSSWGSQFKAIESGDNNNQSSLAFNTNANGLNFFANAFFDGSNTKYKYNGFATRFLTGDGKYEYYNASSGTSGNNITWTEVMTIDASGNLGINQPVPTEKLHVVGNARITGAYSVTTAEAANVYVTSTGVLQRSTSSIKYKTDVEDYSKGLKEVMQLRPVTFKSINSNNDKTYAGFIAEELADLKLNELVENNDSGEPDAISYAYMVTLLTKAIQEQQEQISLLKKRLLILENK